MRAVIYGAGNIGRGFLAQMLYESNCAITFIDVVDAVVDGINREGKYPIHLTQSQHIDTVWVDHVRAVHGSQLFDVIEAVSGADVIITAVGAGALRFIAKGLAYGILRRMSKGLPPINIIICENLYHAQHRLRELVEQYVPQPLRNRVSAYVGYCIASVGRMVPVQTDELRRGNALAVAVEPYCHLPVDADAVVGTLPDIQHIEPEHHFEFFIKRKLYIHNLGHCAAAYMGYRAGYTYISEAISDSEIRAFARYVMKQSADGLAAQYSIPAASHEALDAHIDDLLERFANTALRDTVARVGNDLRRKLSPEDRVMGALNMLRSMGLPHDGAVRVCAAALRFDVDNAVELGAEAILREICKITDDALREQILRTYHEMN